VQAISIGIASSDTCHPVTSLPSLSISVLNFERKLKAATPYAVEDVP
jgi:hypothetical protein